MLCLEVLCLYIAAFTMSVTTGEDLLFCLCSTMELQFLFKILAMFAAMSKTTKNENFVPEQFVQTPFSSPVYKPQPENTNYFGKIESAGFIFFCTMEGSFFSLTSFIVELAAERNNEVNSFSHFPIFAMVEEFRDERESR